MEFKDYYTTLGVKPDATAAEIKSAYRRLARKYHPDVSKESAAEEKFKSVNEAYEALKEPERRKAYDQVRAGGYRGGDEFRGPPPNWQRQAHGGDEGAGQEDFSDFFESLFGDRGGAARRSAARARPACAGRDRYRHRLSRWPRAHQPARWRQRAHAGSEDSGRDFAGPADPPRRAGLPGPRRRRRPATSSSRSACATVRVSVWTATTCW